MVGRPKKVINRLVEKWEHEFLLKVMARKIQRAKPTLAGKTGASPKAAQSAPASVFPSRRPSFQQTAGNPPEQESTHVAATCQKKAQPGAPLIAELERAANGCKEKQATSAQVKPAWKGPMDDVITDFGCGFEFDELPAGPRQQRRQTFGGADNSDSWEPLPRPNRPSAVPQKTPLKKVSRKEERKPVLLVIPVEQAGPITREPRLSRKSESAPSNHDVSAGEGSDVSNPRVGTASEEVSKQQSRKERVPLEPRVDLKNKVGQPVKQPISKLTEGVKKEMMQRELSIERGSSSKIETLKTKKGLGNAKQKGSVQFTSNRLVKNKGSESECSNEGPPLRADVSPREPRVVRRMASSNIPRPRGTPGDALKHKARQSLRPVEDCSDEKGEQTLARLPSRGRYEDTCEEDFPVHQADSGEFFIRTPSSGIDQPLTVSEEAALARQAGREPAFVLSGGALEGLGIGSALEQEIFGLNRSLEAMKETLRDVNEGAKRLKASRRSTKSNASSQGSASEEDDTCRTGESDDERNQDLEGSRESGSAKDKEGETIDSFPSNEEDLDAAIAHQERVRQALLQEVASAKTEAADSLDEHQRDFLSESQGEWAVITGEESHVDGSGGWRVSRGEDEYEDDFEGALVEGEELQTAEETFDVEGEELVPTDPKRSPKVGFLARLSYQVDGVRGSREESLPGSPDRTAAGSFAQLTARGTRKVPVDMDGLTAEIEKLEMEMQRLKR